MNKWSEWISPKMKGYKMECCDCGLVHEMEFELIKYSGKVEKELSHGTVIKDKDIQVLFRVRRSKI